MLTVNLRRFLQGSAVAAGAGSAHRYLFGGFETVGSAEAADLAEARERVAEPPVIHRRDRGQ